MRKLLITALAIGSALTAFADNKFDARGEIMAEQYRRFIKDPANLMISPDQLPFATDIISRSGATATVSIILADNASKSDIEELGFTIITSSETVLVIEGSMDAIFELAESNLVKSVSFAKPVDMHLDMARKVSGVDAIHQGAEDLPQAYTGKGVITGIFDNGFYTDHYNFKDADGTCRISNFWLVTDNDGQKITHYDTPEKVVGMPNATDSKSSSHGTHTLGCMAGNCYVNLNSLIRYDQATSQWEQLNKLTDRDGKPSPWYGPSKESEIVVAAGPLFDHSIMAGLKKVADYIDASGKPGVINLSIGTMLGPRDGSDEFCTFLDEIAAKVPVCVSAGNDGDMDYSLTGNAYNFFIVPGGTSNTCTGYLDLWASDGEAFVLTPVIFDLAGKKVIFSYEIDSSNTKQTIIGNSTYSNVTVKNDNFDKAFTSSYLLIQPKKLSTNNRSNIYVQYSIGYNSTTNADKNLVMGFMVSGAKGQRIDLANRPNSGDGSIKSLGITGWSNGNADMSINSMACGKNSIAVGAWNTRNQWGITTNGKTLIYYPNAETTGLALNDIAGYSSFGELYDGRRMPDLCAPGTGIISSVSTPGVSALQDYTYPTGAYSAGSRNDRWGLMQGTSMSSPFVAGSIALWLEADPTITPAEIKKIAKETCYNDSFTAIVGNELRWGAGKFDALAGIKKILDINSSGINDIVADSSDRLQISSVADNVWNVFVPEASEINLTLYGITGNIATRTSASGSEATLDASNLAKGVYILNVNGKSNTKLVVR